MTADMVMFLVETDESVELPTDWRIISTEPVEGGPEGMPPTVDLTKVEL